MEIMLLKIVGSALILSIAVYLIHSYYINNTGNRYYRKSLSGRNDKLEKLKYDFLEKDRQLKTVKETIGISIHCRNFSNQVMNEVSGLYSQIAENHQIRYLDLQVLERLKGELLTIQEEMNAHMNDGAHVNIEGLGKYNTELIDNFSSQLGLIEDLLNTSEIQRNNLQYMQEAKVKSEKLYHEIVSIHEGVISLFQKSFIGTDQNN
jgi:hypothetical protein